MKLYRKLFLLCAIAASTLCSCTKDAPAKYVFLFIGDGMGASQVAVTESYLSYQQGVYGGEQLLFTTFPVYGTATSYSANSPITDSSAAGTAISSGTKTNNGMLGVDPEGNPVRTMAEILHSEYGYNIGIYSSVPLNHATPAAFYGHSNSRSDYYNITTQIPAAGFEFVGGSGFLKYAGPDHDKDSEKFLEENGYEVVFGQAEYEQYKNCGKKIVMSSNPEQAHREKTANYAAETDELVSLEQMTRNCLEVLGDKKPFFVMCEGGEIDWVCHSDQTMPMVEAIINMDNAVKVAYEFYLKHPKQTLIVVTADHETGGVSVGSEDCGYNVDWKLLIDQWEEAGHRANLSYEDQMALNFKAGFGWTSTHHTGAPVPVFAIGKGAEKFAGRMDNTDIIKKIIPAAE